MMQGPAGSTILGPDPATRSGVREAGGGGTSVGAAAVGVEGRFGPGVPQAASSSAAADSATRHAMADSRRPCRRRGVGYAACGVMTVLVVVGPSDHPRCPVKVHRPFRQRSGMVRPVTPDGAGVPDG